MSTAAQKPHESHPIAHVFHVFARRSSTALGSAWAFVVAIAVVVVWAVSGPYFKYSETWQLVINTGTTIVTFIMVFLIQHAQNHDAEAIHLKLDELLRAVGTARNQIIDMEDLPEDELHDAKESLKHARASANSAEPSRVTAASKPSRAKKR